MAFVGVVFSAARPCEWRIDCELLRRSAVGRRPRHKERCTSNEAKDSQCTGDTSLAAGRQVSFISTQ
jgi:hypothetical protein